LIDELKSLLEKEKPDEIREIGRIYLKLIETIQPIRNEIRNFVEEYKQSFRKK
jgi:hypothetical protein